MGCHAGVGPRDFSGTFSSVRGTSQGLFAVWTGKAVTELKEGKRQVRGGASALDDVHRQPAPGRFLVLDFHGVHGLQSAPGLRTCGQLFQSGSRQGALRLTNDQMLGTSPRARGAAPENGDDRAMARNIPACTGSSRSGAASTGRQREHPRVHGEQLTVGTTVSAVEGTSPRARGAAVSRLGKRPVVGNIPACAGSRRWKTGRGCGWREHPRVRGDHNAENYEKGLITGTPRRRGDHRASTLWSGPPPQARGPRPGARPGPRPPGNTPAGAGPPLESTRGLLFRGTTPAGTGTTPSHWATLTLTAGPPPQARGPPQTAGPPAEGPGTTPAYAGTTSGPLPTLPATGDHPRMRGDRAARGIVSL